VAGGGSSGRVEGSFRRRVGGGVHPRERNRAWIQGIRALIAKREAHPAEGSRQGNGRWVRMRTSGCELATVPVVEAANLRMGNNLAHFGWFNRPRIRAVVVQRAVRPRFVVVGRVATKNP
jgi:hypothetical protein